MEPETLPQNLSGLSKLHSHCLLACRPSASSFYSSCSPEGICMTPNLHGRWQHQVSVTWGVPAPHTLVVEGGGDLALSLTRLMLHR